MGKARRKEKEGNDSASSGDSKLYLEATVLERKLPEMDLRLLVDLPAGLDYNEWLASHTMALFDHVNLVYGTVSEFCTPSGCPDMTGPGQRTYLWFDEKGKKTKVAAPQYIDYVMTFIQKTITDENIFPTKYANEFPSSFESIVRKIVRLLFHVVAHLYSAHFKEVVMLGLHAHLNLTFAHLTALQHRFSLIDAKETEVLKDLEIALRLTEDLTTTTTASTSTTLTATNNSSSSTSTSSGAALATSTIISDSAAAISNNKSIVVDDRGTIEHQHLMDTGGGVNSLAEGLRTHLVLDENNVVAMATATSNTMTSFSAVTSGRRKEFSTDLLKQLPVAFTKRIESLSPSLALSQVVGTVSRSLLRRYRNYVDASNFEIYKQNK